jgi:hypothetical protein
MLAGIQKIDHQDENPNYAFEVPTAYFLDAFSDVLRVRITLGKLVKSVQTI